MRLHRIGRWFVSFRVGSGRWLTIAAHRRWRLGFVRPPAKPGYARLYIGPLEVEHAAWGNLVTQPVARGIHGNPAFTLPAVAKALDAAIAHSLNGSPARQGAEPDGQDLNPVSVQDLSASASPATKEQQ